ncbi:MAG: hypothetical protein KKA10_17605 [Euryarchaeota archaeon]|nr:hypothetical protein [Euryarchaeota archaeon]MCG2738209.1 hypothetical protein [Candidatus Methanoperedenaceae archaeon]
MSRNIKRWIIALIIILVISAGGAIMATKTLALSNNNSYQDIPFTINKTDEQKLITVPPTGKLTAEQEKQIQDIQEQKNKINSSLISFVSGYSILKSPGIERNIDTGMKYYVRLCKNYFFIMSSLPNKTRFLI